MKIRKYRKGEEHILWNLFHSTIHNINIRDYNQAQVIAWTPIDLNEAVYAKKFQDIRLYVVEPDGDIVAYVELQPGKALKSGTKNW